MDLADLQTFRAVVDHGGVTAAALRLHRVQSSVSARLSALEQQLGCALFERRQRRLHLTPEGRHLYARSASILQDMAALRSEFAAASRPAVLHLGAMESTAAARLPPVLARLRAEAPGIQLVLRTGTTGALLDQLRAATLDAALVGGQPCGDGLVWKPACTEELVAIAPQGATAQAAQTLITFGDGCAYRAIALAWAASHHMKFAHMVEIGSYHALVASVAAGMGMALVPRSVLALAGGGGGLHVQPLGAEHAAQTTWLVRRAGAPTPAVEALAGCLLAAA
jgi:DNA-binding transcriptional LysR family regulator